MERLVLGTEGIEVSRMCLGAMALGTIQDKATSYAILDRFVELGGNFIDTANCYMFWVEGETGDASELLLGSWMADRGNRSDLVVATKVGRRPTIPGDQTINSSEPLTHTRIGAGLEESLVRLGTDYVDLFWSHRDDRDTPLADTVAGFGTAVKEGRARMVGASNHTAWRVERARALAAEQGVAAYTAMQNRYSYLQPRPGAVLPEAGHIHASATDVDYVGQTAGMGMLTYNALLAGAYTRPDKPLSEAYDHPGTPTRLAVLDEVARQVGATRNQVVLAWLARHDAPLIPLVGVSSLAQLEEAVAGFDVVLDEEQWQRLSAAA